MQEYEQTRGKQAYRYMAVQPRKCLASRREHTKVKSCGYKCCHFRMDILFISKRSKLQKKLIFCNSVHILSVDRIAQIYKNWSAVVSQTFKLFLEVGQYFQAIRT